MLNIARLRHILGFEAEVAAHQVRREWVGEFIIARKYIFEPAKAGREPGFCVVATCNLSDSAPIEAFHTGTAFAIIVS
jgi:hypothetical protein